MAPDEISVFDQIKAAALDAHRRHEFMAYVSEVLHGLSSAATDLNDFDLRNRLDFLNAEL